MLNINESGQDEALCCSTTNKSNIFLCEHCSCNHTIRIECQVCQQGIQQATPSMCTQSERLPTSVSTKTYQRNGTTSPPSVTMNTGQESSQSLDCTAATPIGVVTGVLVTVLVATVVGWIVTCVVWRRSVAPNRKKFLK